MLKTDWPVKTLGDITTIATGKIDVNAATEDGEYPFFTCSRDVYKIDDAPFEGKAILVAGNGDLNVKYYEGRFNAYQRTYFLLSKNEDTFYPRYIFWFLENHLDVLRSGASGSTIKYIRLGDLSDALIAVPPLEEQKRIVALLDAANARVIELTACYEQARTHANNLFASALRDALKPLDIWPVKRLGDLCLFVRGPFGGSLKKSVFVSTGHAVYEQQHAIYGKFDKFRYFVSFSKFQEMKRFEVFPGDILMSCSGTIGKTAIVPVGAPAGIINQALLKLSCSEKLNNQYLCVWMRSLYFQEAVFASVVGVALQNVASVAILKNIPISLPPLEQQKQIVERLDSMRAKTSEMAAAYDAKLTAATNLRQSILEAAFAGEL
jgi:type I restriction enzyme S subunit